MGAKASKKEFVKLQAQVGTLESEGLQSESVMTKLTRLEAELAQVKEQGGKDAKKIAKLTKKVEDGQVQQAKHGASIKELQKQGNSMKKSLDSIEERQQQQPTTEDFKEIIYTLLQDAINEFRSDSASPRSL